MNVKAKVKPRFSFALPWARSHRSDRPFIKRGTSTSVTSDYENALEKAIPDPLEEVLPQLKDSFGLNYHKFWLCFHGANVEAAFQRERNLKRKNIFFWFLLPYHLYMVLQNTAQGLVDGDSSWWFLCLKSVCGLVGVFCFWMSICHPQWHCAGDSLAKGLSMYYVLLAVSLLELHNPNENILTHNSFISSFAAGRNTFFLPAIGGPFLHVPVAPLVLIQFARSVYILALSGEPSCPNPGLPEAEGGGLQGCNVVFWADFIAQNIFGVLACYFVMLGTRQTFAKNLWFRFAENRRVREEKHIKQEILKQKSQYIAQVAHDIGTPLTTFSLTLELMKSFECTREQEDILETAQCAVELMTVTRSEALDHAKHAEGHGLRPNIREVDVRQLVQKCARIMTGFAGASNLPMDFYVEPPFPRVVMTDLDWTWTMCVNYLSNAKKYSSRGRIITTLYRHTETDMIRFEVADEGKGVPADQKDKLFKAFGQLQTGAGGTGLGLHGVALKAAALGGRVGVRDNPLARSGSAFWVEIPFKSAMEEPPELEKMERVLLVGPWAELLNLDERLQPFLKEKYKHVVVVPKHSHVPTYLLKDQIVTTVMWLLDDPSLLTFGHVQEELPGMLSDIARAWGGFPATRTSTSGEEGVASIETKKQKRKKRTAPTGGLFAIFCDQLSPEDLMNCTAGGNENQSLKTVVTRSAKRTASKGRLLGGSLRNLLPGTGSQREEGVHSAGRALRNIDEEMSEHFSMAASSPHLTGTGRFEVQAAMQLSPLSASEPGAREPLWPSSHTCSGAGMGGTEPLRVCRVAAVAPAPPALDEIRPARAPLKGKTDKGSCHHDQHEKPPTIMGTFKGLPKGDHSNMVVGNNKKKWFSPIKKAMLRSSCCGNISVVEPTHMNGDGGIENTNQKVKSSPANHSDILGGNENQASALECKKASGTSTAEQSEVIDGQQHSFRRKSDSFIAHQSRSRAPRRKSFTFSTGRLHQGNRPLTILTNSVDRDMAQLTDNMYKAVNVAGFQTAVRPLQMEDIMSFVAREFVRSKSPFCGADANKEHLVAGDMHGACAGDGGWGEEGGGGGAPLPPWPESATKTPLATSPAAPRRTARPVWKGRRCCPPQAAAPAKGEPPAPP